MRHNSIEILLVEDNPADVELTVNALKESNIANELYVVGDGEKALEFVFAKGEFSDRNVNHQPKLILLDLKLPKVDGLEVLQKLKADDKTKNIPVVILTSSREETDIYNSYDLGVNSYIVKPVDFEQFSKTVGELGLYWLLINQVPD